MFGIENNVCTTYISFTGEIKKKKVRYNRAYEKKNHSQCILLMLRNLKYKEMDSHH